MHRLFSATLASAMAAAFLFTGSAAIASSGSMSTTHHSSKMMKHSCPAGEHWVKGYTRNGKKVHGYCRK